MQSIDLDTSVSEASSFISSDRGDFALESHKPVSVFKHKTPHAQQNHYPTNSIPEMDTQEQTNKKLSIVLTKEMHRLAKMQALKEDVTLKDLVVRLIQDHLENS